MSGRRDFSARRWTLLALFGIAACNAIAGIEDPVVVESQGESCILNSDCDDPTQVCLFETCSPPCEKDVDCDAGEYCLSTEVGNGCVTTGRARCSDGEACPSGSACFDGECRTDCRINASLCLVDQRCDPDGACRGSGGGGTGGTGGMGGTAGTGPGGEGGGGDGGTGGSVMPGDPCPDEGAFKCTGLASPGRLICTDGVWASGMPCGNGELCDSESDPAGECAVVPDECRGRTPGMAFCEGLTRVVCGPDLVTVERVDCDTIQHCTLATGPDCAACLPNQHQCSGDELEVCNDANTGFEFVETCTDEPCNAQAGACTTLACLTVGARRCMGDRLEECNASRDGFDLVETCEPGLCDPVDLVCDVCIPGELACADSDTQRECDEDGQDHTDTACPTSTPLCTGAGQCVECTQATDCTPPTPCYMRACNTGNGQCEYARFATHQQCSGGYCTAAGECVECTQAGQCQASGACFAAVCDGSNQCDEDPRGTMETCTGGYCNGSGACVQCNVPTQCQTTGPCYDPTCPSTTHVCGQTPKMPRSSCTGGLCNGNGACVACLMDSDCMQPSNECSRTNCVTQACMPGFELAGTPCMTSPWKCDGLGTCVRCLTSTDCTTGSQTLCRNNTCVDPVHTLGWETASGTTSMLAADNLIVKRLPALTVNATLLSFGVVGTATGQSARLALYADNGSTTGPAGPALAVTQNPISLQNGAVELNASPQRALTAGVTYWLAIKVNQPATLRAMSGTVTGRQFIAPPFYSDAFQDFSTGTPVGGSSFSGQIAIYIKVQDTQ